MPEHQHSLSTKEREGEEGRGRRTVILVLVNPALPFLRLDHQLIIPKPSIHKRIHESPCQILFRRVDVRRCPRTVEVRFVNVLERFRSGDGEFAAEAFEVGAELSVVEDLEEGFVVGFDRDLLTGEDVGKLALHHARKDKRGE
jgi:hypothetical protein